MSLPATDNFNRANSGTLGSNWTEQDAAGTGSTNQIVSNQATGSGSRDFTRAFWNADVFGNDQYSQSLLAACNDYMYLSVRASGTGASGANHYVLVMNNGAGQSFIQKVVAGSLTTLASGLTNFNASGDSGKIGVVGTTITVYRDTGSGFVSIGSVTDSSLASGSAGLGNAQVTNCIHDNWQGDNIGGGATFGSLWWWDRAGVVH